MVWTLNNGFLTMIMMLMSATSYIIVPHHGNRYSVSLAANSRTANEVVVSSHDVLTQKVIFSRQLKRTIQSALVLSGAVGALSNANAKVYFDTDVYGDKELKIATVNKIKQKIRNAILQDVSVAPDLLKLAINDALGYDTTSEEGGPDGSIIFEMDRPENKGLEKAVALLTGVKKELQRTNTVSFADLVAFGGAEALETVGAGRITGKVLSHYHM
jgi:hypothetical protein